MGKEENILKALVNQNQPTGEEIHAELLDQEEESYNMEQEKVALETSENPFPSTQDANETQNQNKLEEESLSTKKDKRKSAAICEICNIETSHAVRKSHERGAVHQEMLIQKSLGICKGLEDPFLCRGCKKSYANTKVFHNHLTRICTRQVLEKDIQKKDEEYAINDTENILNETSFNCRECDAVLRSNESFASHMGQHEAMDTSGDNTEWEVFILILFYIIIIDIYINEHVVFTHTQKSSQISSQVMLVIWFEILNEIPDISSTWPQ